MTKSEDEFITRLQTNGKPFGGPLWIQVLIKGLDQKYDLMAKMTREPGVETIVAQLLARIENAFVDLKLLTGNRILDIACGSRSSRAPSFLDIKNPFSGKPIGLTRAKGYTALFEPWFCRILLELDADPVGIDFGDLDGENFEHYRVDLGQIGALDFLASHSFDAVQDSRLFGSPEFRAQFPQEAARLRIAREITRQEQRLLKTKGIMIHSDAAQLLR